MLFSIVNFVFNDRFPFPNGPEGAFAHLGFPAYFKVELTVAKILGVLALVIPAVPFKVKEFAYAGFAITLVSAAVAHFGRGDARRTSTPQECRVGLRCPNSVDTKRGRPSALAGTTG
jgi:DoxX-like family